MAEFQFGTCVPEKHVETTVLRREQIQISIEFMIVLEKSTTRQDPGLL